METHMKHRCTCIAVMCGLSAHDWFAHSIYDPITTDRWNVSGLNILFAIGYLTWDMNAMLFGTNHSILYRKDLLIHHVVSIISFSAGMYFIPLVCSRDLLCESLSLLNYTFRDDHNGPFLHKYRLATILLIRLPITTIHPLFYCRHAHLLEQASIATGASIQSYKLSLIISHLCFIIYDIILIRKILDIIRKKRV